MLYLNNGRTSIGADSPFDIDDNPNRAFQATVAGTGAVSATVLIQVSNDATNWITLATITLSGTNSATDGVAMSAAWGFVRGNVTAISGTGAAVTTVAS